MTSPEPHVVSLGLSFLILASAMVARRILDEVFYFLRPRPILPYTRRSVSELFPEVGTDNDHIREILNKKNYARNLRTPRDR